MIKNGRIVQDEPQRPFDPTYLQAEVVATKPNSPEPMTYIEALEVIAGAGQFADKAYLREVAQSALRRLSAQQQKQARFAIHTQSSESRRLRAMAIDAASRCFTGHIDTDISGAAVMGTADDIVNVAERLFRYIETGEMP